MGSLPQTRDKLEVSPTVSSATEIPLALKCVLGCLFPPMILLAVAGNSVVCGLVYRNGVMRSGINVLLANMACAHILQGLLCQPLAFVTLCLDSWPFGDVLCRVEGFLHSLFMCVVSGMLLIISTDRYLIIVHEQDKLSAFRARMLIVITWGVGLGISLPPAVGWRHYTAYDGWIQCLARESQDVLDVAYISTAHCVAFYIPMVFMTFVYVSIHITVGKGRARVRSYKTSIHRHSIGSIPTISGHVSRSDPETFGISLAFQGPPTSLGPKQRAFQTLFLLFVTNAVCVLPYAVSVLLWNVTGNIAENFIGGDVVIWLAYVNAAVNPVIFYCRIRKFHDFCTTKANLPKCFKLPSLTFWTKRRIHPAVFYECPDAQSTIV